MRLRILTLAAVSALVCAGGGPPAAAAPSASWTVTFAGKGTYTQTGSLSQAPLCATPKTSTFKSNFSWTVTWQNVVFGPNPSAGPPKGHLGGAEHQERNDPGAMCSKPTSCSQDVPFAADEGPTANQGATLKVAPSIGSVAELHLELRESATSGGTGCKSVGTSFENFVLVGTKGTTDANLTGALAAYAKIPLNQLRTAKKIIVVVSKSPFTNYPVTPECTQNQIEGLTCTHTQTWTGTVTLQRP